MAAYGGHIVIARLLLDHDADMDNVDVDGDTPMQLAATRGHSAVAILFDQVRAERDLRAREMDTEQPRK
jgi:ankyrin repeat protein